MVVREKAFRFARLLIKDGNNFESKKNEIVLKNCNFQNDDSLEKLSTLTNLICIRLWNKFVLILSLMVETFSKKLRKEKGVSAFANAC